VVSVAYTTLKVKYYFVESPNDLNSCSHPYIPS